MQDGEPASSTPGPWRRVGRFELGPTLAKGGMAELCIARATGVHGFQKYVVIKRILAKWSDDREFVEMFLDEARLAAQLDHPNVAHVHDIGEDEDGPFFAMDYIHGETLLAIMKACRAQGTTIPLPALVAIGSAAAAGLHHAHERHGFDGQPLGLIHRDISPTNILASYEGALKIVDFGIAKAATSRHATRPSVRKGKMAYMSPEQCRGEALDRRCDLFALGTVLYELATLSRAFAGDGEYAVMNAIVNHDIEPPSARNPELPSGLERIILRLLRRDRDERYRDAQQAQRDLDAFAAGAGLAATPAAIEALMERLFGGKPFPWESVLEASPQVPGTGEVSPATVRTGPPASRGAQTPVTAATKLKPMLDPAPSRRRTWPIAAGLFGVGTVAWLVLGSAEETPRPPGRNLDDGIPTRDTAVAPTPIPTASESTGMSVPPPAPEHDAPALQSTTSDEDGSPAESSDTAAEPVAPPTPPAARLPVRVRDAKPRPTEVVPAPEPEPSLPAPFDPDAPAPRPR